MNPPVNRAAVNKWESGITKNIKKQYIQQLATIFDITPTELMCFDDQLGSSKLEEDNIFEQIQKYFGKDAVQLLQRFNELNELGKQKALEDIDDLTEHPKYYITKATDRGVKDQQKVDIPQKI